MEFYRRWRESVPGATALRERQPLGWLCLHQYFEMMVWMPEHLNF